ncbi:E3 ubiquitin-protein ligase rnf38 [Bonamia ostreae]|uniref:E3 ubiquitin-protein ligase rnf38 n=1 Tax=Bonamia ostreae TaxID=126728 RepID=A0ABV2ASY3_9EUKA
MNFFNAPSPPDLNSRPLSNPQPISSQNSPFPNSMIFQFSSTRNQNNPTPSNAQFQNNPTSSNAQFQNNPTSSNAQYQSHPSGQSFFRQTTFSSPSGAPISYSISTRNFGGPIQTTNSTTSTGVHPDFYELFNTVFNQRTDGNNRNNEFSFPNLFEGNFERIFEYFRSVGARDGNQMQPATEHDIENLPSFVVDKKMAESLTSQKCVFCMEQMVEKEEVRRLPCLHVFHKKEIDQWLKINKVCPVCKAAIDSSDRSQEQQRGQGQTGQRQN